MKGEGKRGEGVSGEEVRKGLRKQVNSYKSKGRHCVIPRGLSKWRKQEIEKKKITTIKKRSIRANCVGDSVERLRRLESCVECVLTRDVYGEGEENYQWSGVTLSWYDSSSPEDILTRALEDMM